MTCLLMQEFPLLGLLPLQECTVYHKDEGISVVLWVPLKCEKTIPQNLPKYGGRWILTQYLLQEKKKKMYKEVRDLNPEPIAW